MPLPQAASQAQASTPGVFPRASAHKTRQRSTRSRPRLVVARQPGKGGRVGAVPYSCLPRQEPIRLPSAGYSLVERRGNGLATRCAPPQATALHSRPSDSAGGSAPHVGRLTHGPKATYLTAPSLPGPHTGRRLKEEGGRAPPDARSATQWARVGDAPAHSCPHPSLPVLPSVPRFALLLVATSTRSLGGETVLSAVTPLGSPGRLSCAGFTTPPHCCKVSGQENLRNPHPTLCSALPRTISLPALGVFPPPRPGTERLGGAVGGGRGRGAAPRQLRVH